MAVQILPLSMVIVVQTVGTIIIAADVNFLYPNGTFLAITSVSAMCFFGFLGLRASPDGRASLQILGVSTTLMVLLLAAVALVSLHGRDLEGSVSLVGFGFVLPAVVLVTYLFLVLRGLGHRPLPVVREGSREGPSVAMPTPMFDARGIVFAALLTSLVPISISMYGFMFLGRDTGILVCCPASLLIGAIYLGVVALRRGTGLHWTVVAYLVVILFGCITVFVGLEEEESMTFFGILVLSYGFIAAWTFLIDAWINRCRPMDG